MADFGANLELIPIALVADDLRGLFRLCYLNNVLNQTKYNYGLPANELSDGKREIWFYGDIKDWKDPSDLTDEELFVLDSFGLERGGL
ncbi:MAG: hypothetical protein V3R57_10110 [Candidatus Bathyarchaeia archaeon]